MILKANNTKATSAPPRPNLPKEYKGPVTLHTGREVFWTGRVAIGLNYFPRQRNDDGGSNAAWLQALLLKK
jgi:hypothetical protein